MCLTFVSAGFICGGVTLISSCGGRRGVSYAVGVGWDTWQSFESGSHITTEPMCPLVEWLDFWGGESEGLVFKRMPARQMCVVSSSVFFLIRGKGHVYSRARDVPVDYKSERASKKSSSRIKLTHSALATLRAALLFCPLAQAILSTATRGATTLVYHGVSQLHKTLVLPIGKAGTIDRRRHWEILALQRHTLRRSVP